MFTEYSHLLTSMSKKPKLVFQAISSISLLSEIFSTVCKICYDNHSIENGVLRYRIHIYFNGEELCLERKYGYFYLNGKDGPSIQ